MIQIESIVAQLMQHEDQMAALKSFFERHQQNTILVDRSRRWRSKLPVLSYRETHDDQEVLWEIYLCCATTDVGKIWPPAFWVYRSGDYVAQYEMCGIYNLKYMISVFEVKSVVWRLNISDHEGRKIDEKGTEIKIAHIGKPKTALSSLSNLLEAQGYNLRIELEKDTIATIKALEKYRCYYDVLLLDLDQANPIYCWEIAQQLTGRLNFRGQIISYSAQDREAQAELASQLGIRHFAQAGQLDIFACLKGVCDCHQLFRKEKFKPFMMEFKVRIAGWRYGRHVLMVGDLVKMQISHSDEECAHCPTCRSRVGYINERIEEPNWQYSGRTAFIILEWEKGLKTKENIVEFLEQKLNLDINSD